MDEPTEARLSKDEPHLECSLCERECFDDHVHLSLGHTVIQVACPDCAARFRTIVKISLAAARQLARRDRELEAKEAELEEETHG